MKQTREQMACPAMFPEPSVAGLLHRCRCADAVKPILDHLPEVVIGNAQMWNVLNDPSFQWTTGRSCTNIQPGPLNGADQFFNKLKQFRGIAMRYDKNAENFLAAIKLASVQIWLRTL